MTGPASAGDTIFALSSGSPPAAIAVLRVSGPAAGQALESLAGRLPMPRMATLASLRGRDGELLDRALVLWFPGPATATGEDLAELHLHGGRATITAVLAALADQPELRAAEPGEFTRRGLANGRLDLAQVEGLADLLSAETEAQRRAALRMTEGGVSRLVEGWHGRVLSFAAEVEAAIEFAEEHEDAPSTPSSVPAGMVGLAHEIAEALASPPAERLHDGIRVVVAGPVNAGKSSLVNALAGREAAIATPVPGTTRDLIEVPIALGGWPFVLTDSAGLRETSDRVERIGVARAEHAIRSADLVLWLGPPDACPAAQGVIYIHAQCDRPGRAEPDDGAQLAVSSITGAGMADLRRILTKRASEMLAFRDDLTLTARQRRLLEAAGAALRRGSANGLDDEMVAEEARCALRALGRIGGDSEVEAMLDALFGRFCIGK